MESYKIKLRDNQIDFLMKNIKNTEILSKISGLKKTKPPFQLTVSLEEINMVLDELTSLLAEQGLSEDDDSVNSYGLIVEEHIDIFAKALFE